MTIDPSIHQSRPRFTVMLDDTIGNNAALSITPDGEIICTMHPSAAEDNSPARSSGHVMFRKAVELATRHSQQPDTGNSAS